MIHHCSYIWHIKVLSNCLQVNKQANEWKQDINLKISTEALRYNKKEIPREDADQKLST